MHVQTGCSGNDSDIVIPSSPCSDSQPADSPRFLMDGLRTKHRVWLQRFGTSTEVLERLYVTIKNNNMHCVKIWGHAGFKAGLPVILHKTVSVPLKYFRLKTIQTQSDF